jgi:hypothetical protein
VEQFAGRGSYGGLAEMLLFASMDRGRCQRPAADGTQVVGALPGFASPWITALLHDVIRHCDVRTLKSLARKRK